MNDNITITGRLGHDPEIRYTKTGKAVSDLSLAVNARVKRGAGYEDSVTWHRIVLWERLATDAQSLRKGAAIRVEGIPKSRTFQGRDGNTRTVVEVVAEKFDVLDSLPKSAPANGTKPANSAVPRAQIPADDSDVPF